MSYKIIHATTGRIRVYMPRLASDREYADKLKRILKSLKFVNDVCINSMAKSLTISYEHSLVSSVEMQEHLTNAMQKATAPKISTHSTSALAKRLGVSSQALTWRRAQDDFAEWSQAKDPEGIAWKFDPKSKTFEPILHLDDAVHPSKVWNMMQTIGKSASSKVGGIAGRVAGEVLGLTLLGTAGFVLGSEVGAFLGEEIGAFVGEGFIN